MKVSDLFDGLTSYPLHSVDDNGNNRNVDIDTIPDVLMDAECEEIPISDDVRNEVLSQCDNDDDREAMKSVKRMYLVKADELERKY